MTPLPKDEAKRQRIIDAAIEVFARDGLSNGKIATIAKKAVYYNWLILSS